jgi:hypothetical protein
MDTADNSEPEALAEFVRRVKNRLADASIGARHKLTATTTEVDPYKGNGSWIVTHFCRLCLNVFLMLLSTITTIFPGLTDSSRFTRTERVS